MGYITKAEKEKLELKAQKLKAEKLKAREEKRKEGRKAKSKKKHVSTPINEMYPVRVKDLKSAKRLLTRLIRGLQVGTITGRNAKDLCYLLTVFITLHKEQDYEERLIAIENKLQINRQAA